ncbi:hypothetical protein [Pseudomonas cavernae]|uniref:hypothetical protein n=1 Tax=Pseudomonas cavernae TaxID=2320867 RepID=UPI0013C46FEF|nr:hypothetical protein [Pseudomonas cavernae]
MNILTTNQRITTRHMPAPTNRKIQIKLRTIALMNTLRIEVRAKNPHQFSIWIQENASNLSWPDLVDSNRLYKYFKGNVSRHPDQILKMLDQIFGNIENKYWSGPEGLWTALWGDTQNLSENIKNTCKISEKDSIENAINKFFMTILVHGESSLLSSLSIYRFLSITDPYSRFSDGNGFSRAHNAYEQTLKNLETTEAKSRLTALGVFEAVRQEIIEIERARIALKPAWVTSLEFARL